ncbi:RNA-directed DNA polymerase [Hymenobacter sp. BT491]|uniref:RNA-directed DNA polymerase n=1 Tax=Hymenobacter sp. BT491 TaxID=2766779 RepID=UPI0016535DAA|nr:RNA-directed DNA polymerase [Hymenobacter sp. BT491]MBC6992291.1 RNA-directed DNA polymerase [Hymenobacter sp. BT491]
MPPLFTTEKFAKKISLVDKEWEAVNRAWPKDDKKKLHKYLETRCVDYNVPKGGLRFSRRNLSVPNPLSQWHLSQCISESWPELSIYFSSAASASLPIYTPKGLRSIRTKLTYGEFRRSGILDSYGKIYEIKTDIAKYFASIYTHSIAWALHTKSIAKEKREDYNLLGNKLDRYIRRCQSGQTMGIPIGPDTSVIISEIIGCWIDSEFSKRISDYVGYRYVDDFILYFSNKQQAEKAIRVLQEIFTSLSLEMNDSKTYIKRSPHFIDNGWAYAVSNYVFSKEDRRQNADIVQFFDLAFKYAINFPVDNVMKYAVNVISNLSISASNWQLYESLLMKTVITEPTTIKEFSIIMFRNRGRVSIHKLKEVIYIMLEEHIYKGHSFEVGWALWLTYMFQIKISDKVANSLFLLQDATVLIQSLYLKEKGLISNYIDISPILYFFDRNALNNEFWLLVYEAILNKWVPSEYEKIVNDHPFFSILKKNDVSFINKSILPGKRSIEQFGEEEYIGMKENLYADNELDLLAQIEINSYF